MIVIPMAGMSSRFLKCGYDKPKYQLEIKGKPLFDYCVLSFVRYFKSERFVFIVRDLVAKDFVARRCDVLEISQVEIVVLDKETRGQAETVYLGLNLLQQVSVVEKFLIFNIDTIRPNYVFPKKVENSHGYLEVFAGEGDGWSFVEPGEDGKVLKTTEKIRISNLCSTGLYYFSKIEIFKSYFEKTMLISPENLQGGEYYVAPMYNDLISDGLKVQYVEIDRGDVIFSGIPAEYEYLLKNTQLLIPLEINQGDAL
ncbi:glycosyltransferase family 2 protein [Bermanella sp. WJH001]|uniref:glycosyltransferase family 2 protein n=1 Tax=Bermanella sp. WJH001 TaxID=3048005 RepID=UPI0024BD69D9|nr:glycosyltransferase family 2 protein [Bermanella sp. WJH001]MDJ1536773.1 glycosyltransferase family 2 protein [Bermanella sp. WJH001]